MALARISAIRRLHRSFQSSDFFSTFDSGFISRDVNRSYKGFVQERGTMSSSQKIQSFINLNEVSSKRVYSMKMLDLAIRFNPSRSLSSKIPGGAQKVSLRVTLLSPGIVYEPYKPAEPIPFWKRCFTPSGWRRTKEDFIMEMKSAYAITKLKKKTGYTKKSFYNQAVRLYKEINTLIANGDLSSLRKIVTDKMYSTLKNELKRRESTWDSVHWELVENDINLRTLRARMIGIDKNDLEKAFVQLTIQFLAKQKFEAYDKTGAVVAGDKTKAVLVKDIWVFERSLFHPGADWRLCARISL